MTSPLSAFEMTLGRGDLLLYVTVRADVGQSFKGDFINPSHGPEIDIKEVIVSETLNGAGDVVAPFKGEKVTLTEAEHIYVYDAVFQAACYAEEEARRARLDDTYGCDD